jgi:hypothetical protein
MPDTKFKNARISFPGRNWRSYSNGGKIGDDQYKPDRAFKDDADRVVCVIESSSTNDRKVGVGELCLADKFFSDNSADGILIFSLCGRSAHPPRPDTQAKYLEPYFKYLRRANLTHGVREIYLILEHDFSELEWRALTDEFMGKAEVIKA